MKPRNPQGPSAGVSGGMPPTADHIFISYAWEDRVAADWLTLRLTAAGYRVWCDRFKMLGGERFPEHIDEAIKNRTFRMLGLLSQHSLHKPNPSTSAPLRSLWVASGSAGVLKAYGEQGGGPLSEIFLHSRSQIDDEEFTGYVEGAKDSGARVTGIRVRREWRGVKMFRWRQWPVLRGTFWKADSRSGYLWSSGFKPTVLSYDGSEVPTPLRIDIQHGDADIEQVARDIMGLTKLNYNACKVGDAVPVTIKFSDAVGEILVSNPNIAKPKANFKFYI